MLFPDFATDHLDTGDATIAVRHAGSGPPVLLLHGFPQTSAMWHQVAPALAREHTVVVPDLRGYGSSSKPAASDDHAAHSFRAMAADQVAVMRALGHDRFAVVGHDRGARVTHRMALDHPERVERLAVLDIVPTVHVLATADLTLAQRYYHWFFLSRPEPLPETLIGGDPVFFLHANLGALGGSLDDYDAEALAEYERCARDPGTVRGWCEDYRAALSIDAAHDRADADRLLTQPLLALWGARGAVAELYDPLAVWRGYGSDVRGQAVDAGHFLVEQRPQECTTLLQQFLS
ncbi:alpha/beta hydrolase [Rhodococcus sp. X156]|uniref:alpha/beta fold hydrolase n=1 Tax=Rhodococcus sp. X156 TaxID=2499145 RepID=UPI0019D1F231|nr:alpha/beta hydrolase [Rhodococcus sp. X156]